MSQSSSPDPGPAPQSFRVFFTSPSGGIAFILIGMLCISVNDMLIKRLSSDYPLHQMVFVRSTVGLLFSLIIVQFEGGWSILRPRRPWMHVLRAVMVVFANMTFFMALAVMPLADVTAMFFVAPLFITLLSIPVLGEKVGPRRLIAVLIGFVGVLIIVRPGSVLSGESPPLYILILPVLAALAYAGMQVLTRALRMTSKASAMSVYIQSAFILIGLGFYIVAGDGRFAVGVTNESLIFLLRPWEWPAPEDRWMFVVLGLLSAIVGYALSQAYRLGDAATIAPYEYSSLPLAVFWGWLIFGTLPGWNVVFGIVLIMGAGIYVFLRERVRKQEASA